MSELIDFLRSLMPLHKDKKETLEILKGCTKKEDHTAVEKLMQMRKIEVKFTKLGTTVVSDRDFPQLEPVGGAEKEVQHFCSRVNGEIVKSIREELFKELAKDPSKIIQLIAPNIIGLDHVKEAVLLQMFSKEQLHILLLGDPSTGKTDIIKAASLLMPISSFGLGSGTSGAGLAVTAKGKEVSKGLLPMADKGLCCIDELNLMKKTDYASLYNAMEKGFVSYDKGGNHYKFDARVNVLATANPKGDKFKGTALKAIKSQMPFDAALVSRFHLVFVIKQPDIKEIKKIAKNIIQKDSFKLKKEDIDIITEFIRYSSLNEIEFSSGFDEKVGSFIENIKKNENKYIIEVSPRLVLGVIRLAKASARIHGRAVVEKDDLAYAERVIDASLNIN